MQKLLPILISSCAALSLVGAAVARPLQANAPASTWVKLDATNVHNKPYQVYAHGDTLLDSGTSCDANENDCAVIKMEATPFSKNGKMHVNMFYSTPTGLTCRATFDEIPFTIKNDNLEIASASYKTNWVLTYTNSQDENCPASTISLTISPLVSINYIDAYEFKLSESK